jgi:hypothetical protein
MGSCLPTPPWFVTELRPVRLGTPLRCRSSVPKKLLNSRRLRPFHRPPSLVCFSGSPGFSCVPLSSREFFGSSEDKSYISLIPPCPQCRIPGAVLRVELLVSDLGGWGSRLSSRIARDCSRLSHVRLRSLVFSFFSALLSRDPAIRLPPLPSSASPGRWSSQFSDVSRASREQDRAHDR